MVIGFHIDFENACSTSYFSPYTRLHLTLPFLFPCNPPTLVSPLSLYSNILYFSFFGRIPPFPWSLTSYITSVVIVII